MPHSAEPATRSASRGARRAFLGAAVGLVAGLAIAWLDTRPNWDDTGISVGLLLVGSAAAGQLGAPWWLAGALTVAPLLIAELRGDMTLLIAVPIAMAGGFAGAFLRKLTQRR